MVGAHEKRCGYSAEADFSNDFPSFLIPIPLPSSAKAIRGLIVMTTTISPTKLGTMEGFMIGIIGMGDMGKMYTRRLSEAGWR